MKFEKVNSATGAASPGYSRNNSASVLVNHHTGTMNDGKLINKGRGPTVGNKSDDNSMYPDAAVVPKLPAQGSVHKFVTVVADASLRHVLGIQSVVKTIKATPIVLIWVVVQLKGINDNGYSIISSYRTNTFSNCHFK
jgi:hypothetical protein